MQPQEDAEEVVSRVRLTVARDAVVAGLQFVSRCVHHEVAKLAAERPEAAHLPVDPVEALLALRGVSRDEAAVLLREVLHDRGRLEQADRLP